MTLVYNVLLFCSIYNFTAINRDQSEEGFIDIMMAEDNFNVRNNNEKYVADKKNSLDFANQQTIGSKCNQLIGEMTTVSKPLSQNRNLQDKDIYDMIKCLNVTNETETTMTDLNLDLYTICQFLMAHMETSLLKNFAH